VPAVGERRASRADLRARRAALIREVDELGRSLLAAWRRDCPWCVIGSGCQGDRYLCALIEREWRGWGGVGHPPPDAG
jgi:hypothetical protein